MLVQWVTLILFIVPFLAKTHASDSCIRSCKTNDTDVEFHQLKCYCDPLCHAYRDCCQDADQDPPFSNENGYPVFNDDMISCESSYEYNGNTKTKQGITIITKCPSTFHGDPKPCEDDSITDIFHNVPVNALQTKILYKNFFCALCNEPKTVRSMKDVWFWNATKECQRKPDVPQGMQSATEIIRSISNTSDHDCQMGFRADPENYRRCYTYIKHCPDTWIDPEVDALCHNHTDIVFEGYAGMYRNKFCAMCHGVNETDCADPYADFNPGGMEGNLPYSLLINFNDNSWTYSEEDSTVNTNALCEDTEMYDMTTLMCRKVVDEPINRPRTNSCPMVMYDQSEYEILPNNSVIITKAHMVYSLPDYEIHDDILYVCYHDMMSGNHTDDVDITWDDPNSMHSKVRGIITAVGLIISLICLGICVFAHFVFPALKNLPGKCVIGLSISLFVGQILFLTTLRLENHEACFAFALIMHYAFLASFCWMNSLAFDICRAFSRTLSGKGNQCKQYIRYSMYAWGTPLSIVIIAVIVQVAPGVDEHFRPNYAQPFCWFNNGKSLLVLFALPLAIILLANIVFFVITVKHICISKKYGRSVSKNDNKQTVKLMDVVLYVKLSVIMGLTWIFGFIAAASNSLTLWYFFDIFNSLQGVLIFVSFVLTKRVLKLTQQRRSSIRSTSFFRSFKRKPSITFTVSDQSKSTKTTSDNAESSSIIRDSDDL